MLKIKNNVDLKELEKFGFEYYCENHENNSVEKYSNGHKFYTEQGYRFDDGTNTIDVMEERKNGNWIFPNKERELYIYESDYEMGISENMIDIIFDLIQAGLVEKVDKGE